jgi:hypothetical protein
MGAYQAVPCTEFNNAVFDQVVIGLIAEPDTPGSNRSGIPDGQVKDAEEITTRKSNNGLVGCVVLVLANATKFPPPLMRMLLVEDVPAISGKLTGSVSVILI